MTACTCESIIHAYGNNEVLKGVDLSVEPGTITALLGPSGCGKSTLLRLIAGLEDLQGGHIAIDGERVAQSGRGLPPEKRRVGMVFQDLALFPHFSLKKNVTFACKHLPKAQRQTRAQELLDQVGMGDRSDDMPHRLSGGQQQRVALARALARDPRLLLLDEPFSGLDAALRWRVREDVRRIIIDSGTAAIVVTHDPEEAMHLADHIVLLEEGVVALAGSPETCFRHPATAFGAAFFADCNKIPASVEANQLQYGTCRIPVRSDIQGSADAVIRLGALSLGDPDPQGARIADIRFMGNDYLVDVDCGDGLELVALCKGLPPGATIGDRFALEADPRGVFVFAADLPRSDPSSD